MSYRYFYQQGQGVSRKVWYLLGFKVQGSRFKVQGVQGSRFRVQGSGFMVQSSGHWFF
jgi:hypothetical protein